MRLYLKPGAICVCTYYTYDHSKEHFGFSDSITKSVDKGIYHTGFGLQKYDFCRWGSCTLAFLDLYQAHHSCRVDYMDYAIVYRVISTSTKEEGWVAHVRKEDVEEVP